MTAFNSLLEIAKLIGETFDGAASADGAAGKTTTVDTNQVSTVDDYFNGGTGHIAVVVDADAGGLVCFSQNDPAKSPAILKHYGYKFILGWLHPKGELSLVNQTDAG